MAENETDEDQPELADVVPLPDRTVDEPPSDAELREAMLREGQDLREAFAADPVWAGMRRAFGPAER